MISVCDSGAGISREDARHLFQLFGRVENTEHINTQGVGLGLTICKSIVNRLGGNIWLDQENNHGAKFDFTLENIIK
jgi:two-component system sensor histidine kinase BarA